MSKGAAGANEPRPRVSSLWWAASLDSLFRLWLSRALSGGRDDVDEDDARCAPARARRAPAAGYAGRSRTRPDRRVGIGQGLQPGANFKNVITYWPQWHPEMPLPELPASFGLDAAGVVAVVGSQVLSIRPGDR